MIVRVKDYGSWIPKGFAGLFGDDGDEDYLAVAIVDKAATMDLEQRTLGFVATDDSLDRDNEIIAKGAFHALRGGYMSNPVILLGHTHEPIGGFEPIVGKTLELATERNPVVGRAEFFGSPIAQAAWEARSKGCGAFSVGFKTRETARRDGHRVITKAELIEISAVPVPANRNALVLGHIEGRLGKAARYATDAGWRAELLDAVRGLEQIAAKAGRAVDMEGDHGAPNAADVEEKVIAEARSLTAWMDERE
jgi:HK97 family phage prohead protease